MNPIFTSFSLVTNTKRLLKTTGDSGQISCLHGVRVVSMMWVIFGHTYHIASRMPSVNPANIVEVSKNNVINYSFVNYLKITTSVVVRKTKHDNIGCYCICRYVLLAEWFTSFLWVFNCNIKRIQVQHLYVLLP